MQTSTKKSQSKTQKKKLPLKALDFFCGAGGMTNGFTKAGVKVIAGIDIDSECQKTYETNHPKSKFIQADIKELTFKDLIKKTKIKRNDKRMIFIGCSPCQYWSKMSTDKTKSKKSRNLLKDFQRFVHYFKPGYIVVENVPGILREKASPLESFLKFLEKEKYSHNYDILNASHYGVPQTRRRFLLIASNQKVDIKLPKPDKEYVPTVKEFIGSVKTFKPIRAGHTDTTEFIHSACKLEPQNIERLKLTPRNGGTRLSWKKTKLQLTTYKQRDDSFQDIYGRMFWNKPAPTITTKFFSISNGRFAHPTQNRAISLREGATLQTFGLKYKFIAESISSKARLIGNAVPPELAKRIGKAITYSYNNGPKTQTKTLKAR